MNWWPWTFFIVFTGFVKLLRQKLFPPAPFSIEWIPRKSLFLENNHQNTISKGQFLFNIDRAKIKLEKLLRAPKNEYYLDRKWISDVIPWAIRTKMNSGNAIFRELNPLMNLTGNIMMSQPVHQSFLSRFSRIESTFSLTQNHKIYKI